MDDKRLEKNLKISTSKRATIERHSTMKCKSFTVKIQENKLSKLQKEQLKMLFVEAKWFKNHILNWSNQETNSLWKFDTKTKEIERKDKDGNSLSSTLKYLPASIKQSLLNDMVSNLKTLHTLKNKGNKVGKLKFVKEVKSLSYKQFNVTHKIYSSKKIKLQGISGRIQVNGLNQFLNLCDIEICNARLLNTPKGYYVQFVTYIPKENKKLGNGKTIGIDFGCSTSFTTSEGVKVDAFVRESERLKRLQRKFARQEKGSKRRAKTLNLIKIEYQKLTNQKNDLANKLVAKFLENETIVIQDEQLQGWQKNGHGKAIQHSVLGRVKSKLKQNPKTSILAKSVPTTKLCTKCGVFHDELTVKDRMFVCDCGVEADRDIHAAQNMVWFYENNIGMERTNYKRMEMKALVEVALSGNQDQLLSLKCEAS